MVFIVLSLFSLSAVSLQSFYELFSLSSLLSFYLLIVGKSTHAGLERRLRVKICPAFPEDLSSIPNSKLTPYKLPVILAPSDLTTSLGGPMLTCNHTLIYIYAHSLCLWEVGRPAVRVLFQLYLDRVLNT